jgi:hypothetical protein
MRYRSRNSLRHEKIFGVVAEGALDVGVGLKILAREHIRLVILKAYVIPHHREDMIRQKDRQVG